MTRIQQTVATYFRYSLMDLLAKMVTGTPHFVRYHMLGFRWDEKVTHTPVCCYQLLDRLKLDNWVLGKTKVFLKYYHIEILARRYEDLNKKVILVQSQIRMWLARTKFYRIKWKREKSAIIIQKSLRGYVARKKYKKLYQTRHLAAITIQKVKNPPPVCLKIPGLKKKAKVCIEFYNLAVSGKQLKGCSKLLVKVFNVKVATVELGCFTLPFSDTDVSRLKLDNSRILFRAISLLVERKNK
ncbi:hypothetical protein KUTeg_002418 [Tegillarca granosa]|uniref:DUF4773 domain-containing protein n=1 Tax=Tegillarca granosa TaxID=220873 RepID=A0ABQ9FXH3_TEGGR|nr:hypothetical protein KUTeg_002418 [Tegillarca granosa]